MQHPFLFGSMASSGQLSALQFREQLLFLMFVASIVVAAGIIFLVLFRKWTRMRRGSGMAAPVLDVGSLGKMQEKGLLTAEELKRIRQAVLRQAMGEDRENADSALLREAKTAIIPAAGSAALGDAEPTAIAPTPLQRSAPAPAGTAQDLASQALPADLAKASPPLKTGSTPQTMDLEKLLEKGLISAEEYERLRRHFGDAK